MIKTSSSIFLFTTFLTLIFHRISNPSSYTADALDVFLRIVAPKLFGAYGKRFFDLLILIENEVLPKLKENSSKIRLKEFLVVSRDSRGRNFLPFFKKK